MGWIHRKLKAFWLRPLLLGDSDRSRRESESSKKPSWMVPISHGYHVVEDQSLKFGYGESDADLVVVQREQIEANELWFFGVFDAQVGDGVTKFIQTNLFDRKLKESQIRRNSKETMRRAHVGARAKIRDTKVADETLKAGSASALVINGEKLVIANMGDYRAVVCRDGEAFQLSRRHQKTVRRHWSRKFIRGALRMPRIRILSCDSSNGTGTRRSTKSDLAVATVGIDSDTEFVILASAGIWEVMKDQEAVNLISHLEDPQEAAECLAKEALIRMSRSSISCLVIRFD